MGQSRACDPVSITLNLLQRQNWYRVLPDERHRHLDRREVSRVTGLTVYSVNEQEIKFAQDEQQQSTVPTDCLFKLTAIRVFLVIK